MRIVNSADRHDYYDTVKVYAGSPEGNIFYRQPVEHDINRSTPNIFSCLLENYSPTSLYYGRPIFNATEQHLFSFSYARILFCGKLYGTIRVVKKGLDNLSCLETVCFYTMTELEEYFKKNEIHFSARNVWRETFCKEVLSRLIEPAQDFLEYAIANKLVIAIINFASNDHRAHIEINGLLKPYQFFKVFNAYAAYQELQMFVDGQLAYPGNAVVEVANEYKIKAHGFDHKYAFKKEPELKK